MTSRRKWDRAAQRAVYGPVFIANRIIHQETNANAAWVRDAVALGAETGVPFSTHRVVERPSRVPRVGRSK